MRSEIEREVVVCLKVVLTMVSDCRGLRTGDLETVCKLKNVCVM